MYKGNTQNLYHNHGQCKSEMTTNLKIWLSKIKSIVSVVQGKELLSKWRKAITFTNTDCKTADIFSEVRQTKLQKRISDGFPLNDWPKWLIAAQIFFQIDLRYQSIQEHDYEIHVKLSGIFIAQVRYSLFLQWTRTLEKWKACATVYCSVHSGIPFTNTD